MRCFGCRSYFFAIGNILHLLIGIRQPINIVIRIIIERKHPITELFLAFLDFLVLGHLGRKSWGVILTPTHVYKNTVNRILFLNLLFQQNKVVLRSIGTYVLCVSIISVGVICQPLRVLVIHLDKAVVHPSNIVSEEGKFPWKEPMLTRCFTARKP